MNLLEQIEAKLAEKPWRDPRYNGGYEQRSQLEQVVAAKKLTIKAKDNHGYEYDVYLYMENLPCGWCNTDSWDDEKFRNEMTMKWTLRIKGTPGGWYMTTLLENGGHYPSGISIDSGQNWGCVNFQAVLDEARRLI